MARKLEGTERGLDALVGVVILVAEIVIGFLALYAIYDASMAPPPGADEESLAVGLAIAVVGSLLAVGITTLVYLVRIAIGRRSWTAPLWGTVLMSIALFIGWIIMASGT